MKKFQLTNQKIDNLLLGLQAISRPHPQTTSDGKTVTRDFDIPAKARVLLLENMTLLKELSDKKEARRLRLVQTMLPKGEAGHTPEEVAAFQVEYVNLMQETVDVDLYQVWLYDEATTKPDAIDLTKAPIPFNHLVDLNRIVLIRPETGNSEAKG